MKITRLTDRRLTPADVAAMQRMRRLIRPCQLAFINDHVAVALRTNEDDPLRLAALARDQMHAALEEPDVFGCFVAADGLDAVYLAGQTVYILSHPGEPQCTMNGRHTLYCAGLAACRAGTVQAIVTGEEESLVCSPEDIDSDAPPRSYLQELDVHFYREAVPAPPDPEEEPDWEEILDFTPEPDPPESLF